MVINISFQTFLTSLNFKLQYKKVFKLPTYLTNYKKFKKKLFFTCYF